MSSSTSSSDTTQPPSRNGRWSRYALRAAAFLALVAIVLVLLGEALEATMLALDANYPKIAQMMALRGEHNDVVYLGDSTTLESVNPAVIDEQLGIQSYNLATGGQSAVESEVVLREYLAHNERPRLVVLGLYCEPSASRHTPRRRSTHTCTASCPLPYVISTSAAWWGITGRPLPWQLSAY